MTRQEIISWLKKYIRQENEAYQCEAVVNNWKSKIEEHSKPLVIEKKTGFLGCVGSGIFVAIIGAIPSAIVSGIIWIIWDIVEIIKVDLRHNPGADLRSEMILEKALSIIIKSEDPTQFLSHHGFWGAALALLIIGFGISCLLGIIVIILCLLDDKDVPKRNIKHQEEYEENQALIPQLQVVYDLSVKKKNIAECKLSQMRRNSIVPEKYLSSASTLLEFFEDGRADTIKEALNLLHRHWNELDRYREMERHNRAMEEEAAQHNAQIEAELQRNTEAARRAANAAEDAAYWEKQRYIDDVFERLLK
ncbi:MAG: hypothetical protein ACI3W7_05465 [Oscillospiraceae bacterium]